MQDEPRAPHGSAAPYLRRHASTKLSISLTAERIYGQNGYIVRSLVVPVGVLYEDVCVLLCGQLLRRSIYEGQNHGPDHASELLCTYLISTTNKKAESNLKTMKSDPEVEVCPQGCQLGIHPEGWPHSVKGRRPGLRPLLLLPGSPCGQERTRVRAQQKGRRVRRGREESVAEPPQELRQVPLAAREVQCLRQVGMGRNGNYSGCPLCLWTCA